MATNNSLIKKISDRQARIAVIGLGYVGLPLTREFSKAGFRVTGFDIDAEKVGLLNNGKSYIKHVPPGEIKKILQHGRFRSTADFPLLGEMDCIVICVPTPLNKHREPDLSFVLDSTRMIARSLRKGQLIILESTTYPGTTDEDMRTILERTGMKAGRDFHLAFSPEREDPANRNFSTATIPKVVGGYTRGCLRAAQALYDSIVVKTVPVSSTRAAEATKLLENIYRAVNIALVNEMKMLFDRMDIDIWEVIEASKTKPFGFQAFYPGPGLGGHCIPIDPFYLTWKAREYGFPTRFIELAGEINTLMPGYVVSRVVEALNENGKSVKGSKILVLGLAYKKDVDDVRESASLEIITRLAEKGAAVAYNDPHVPRARRTAHYDLKMSSVPLSEKNLKGFDCIVISTDHSAYDYDFIGKHARLIVDTRNAMKKAAHSRMKGIVKA